MVRIQYVPPLIWAVGIVGNTVALEINTAMKRLLITDMPWDEIQSLYDSGMSLRDLSVKFKMGLKTFNKAKKLKLFIPRDMSSAMRLHSLKNPRDYSEVRSKRSDLANYRADCTFKFNLSDFPDEFDFSLIEAYGWYKPKNRGNNLNGVSRDHAISVRYGFDNGIPAYHLSHPANCILMKHGDNVAKYTRNSFTYEELLQRIDRWNKKYGL